MKICSLNVRGVHNKIKRKNVFSQFRQNNMDIILLQETHLANECSKADWEMDWKGTILYSAGESNARGVAILLQDRFNHKILDTVTDNEGRVVITKVEVEGKVLVIGNVYAPNSDHPEFFTELIEKIESIGEYDCLVLGGDFKLVMDPGKDRYNSLYNHCGSAMVIKEYMERVKIEDVWRIRNPDKRSYSWHRGGTGARYSLSRIDFFLISQCYLNKVQECDMKAAPQSDHKIVTMDLQLDDVDRGPGIWKLNMLHLLDEVFKDETRELLRSMSQKYPTLNPNEMWEAIIKDATEYSKQYGKRKAKQSKTQ